MLLLEEEKLFQQLDLFEENLPHKPYCSDQKGWLKVRPKAIASLKKYIQHNEPTKIKWLVYDIDYAGVLEHISYNKLPPPNLVAFNPESGKAHCFYSLNTAVCITDNGRFKPKDFLRKVSFQLGELLESDRGYTNFVSKNPLNDYWEVIELEKTSYDLGDFLQWFDIPLNLPKVYKVVGVGRNVTTFEHGRRWAYRNVLAYRLEGKRDAFNLAVLSHCHELNLTYPTPLRDSEVKAIAKSISNWTWKYYTARWSDEKFSEIQAKRGRLGGLKAGRGRTPADQEKRLKALSMASTMTQKAIAEVLGVRQGTISKWLKS